VTGTYFVLLHLPEEKVPENPDVPDLRMSLSEKADYRKK
jgi:hypothetical protein